MNTYSKFCPNVYLAKCPEPHESGEIISVTTQYGKENDCVVYNLIFERNGFFYYSIVRADGFNSQERAKAKAERLNGYSDASFVRSAEFYEKSNEGRDFLALGEPIKVGHHSEKRHRALIERNNSRMRRSVEESEKAADYASRAQYWESKANKIDLSMPESLEYFAYRLEKAKERHLGLKNGTIERDHSYSLTYAKKEVNEAEKNLSLAKRLWAPKAD